MSCIVGLVVVYTESYALCRVEPAVHKDVAECAVETAVVSSVSTTKAVSLKPANRM